MSKVLFELNLKNVRDLDFMADCLTDCLSKEMLILKDEIFINLNENIKTYDIGFYSLTEFVEDCSEDEKQFFIYKMLLERLYPVIIDKKILFMAEMDCFRPGYISYRDVEDFTSFLCETIKKILIKVQDLLRKKTSSLGFEFKVDIRQLFRVSEIMQIGIRDLDFKENLLFTSN